MKEAMYRYKGQFHPTLDWLKITEKKIIRMDENTLKDVIMENVRKVLKESMLTPQTAQ